MKKFTTSFTRSNKIESFHEIKILVKNLNNKTLLSSNNDNEYIYPRSSIKIFQAIPFIKTRAFTKYRLSRKILALACSSHRGEVFHIKELKDWIKKIGIVKDKLKCGIHKPLNIEASEALIKSKKMPSQLHNNCAGKHLAMITSCIMNNHSLKNYLAFNHPHQVAIREVFEKFTNKKINKNNFGIDGCSAPQYSFKIIDIVKMLANLVKSYNGNFDYNHETKLLIESIITNPNFIGGSDSLDSKIMTISNKKIFCKGGAEGVFIFAELKKGIVGVIKVTDGNERAIPSVIYNLFKKYNLMNNLELKRFRKFYNFTITNHANIKIGSIETKI